MCIRLNKYGVLVTWSCWWVIQSNKTFIKRVGSHYYSFHIFLLTLTTQECCWFAKIQIVKSFSLNWFWPCCVKPLFQLSDSSSFLSTSRAEQESFMIKMALLFCPHLGALSLEFGSMDQRLDIAVIATPSEIKQLVCWRLELTASCCQFCEKAKKILPAQVSFTSSITWWFCVMEWCHCPNESSLH